MNKPRQYRGISIESGEWVYGWYACRDFDNGAISHYIAERLENSDGYVYYVEREVRPETVGQSTGLTDKNGKEIFEGDLCKTDADILWECKWEATHANYTIEPTSNQVVDCMDAGIVYQMEITGSIHDHLLKEKQ